MTRQVQKLSFIVSASSIILASCTTKESERITYEHNDSIDQFLSIVDYIEVIPLQNDGKHFLGSEPELHLCDNSYIVADKFNKNIYRYSRNGDFMNEIGSSGNGPDEYITIDNIQIISDNHINVYSAPGKVLTFDKKGSLLDRDYVSLHGIQTYYTGNSYLVYQGNGTGEDNKLALVENNKVTTLLRASNQVLNFASNVPIFSDNQNGSIIIIDSYNPVIYKFDNDLISEYMEFDFRDSAVPISYYQHEDPFTASQTLFAHDFTFIRRCFENTDYCFAEFYTRHPDTMPSFSYGIRCQGDWKWFSTGAVGEMPLTASFRTFDEENNLYAIVDPIYLSRCQPEILSRVKNASILDAIGMEDNYVIFKIKLI